MLQQRLDGKGAPLVPAEVHDQSDSTFRYGPNQYLATAAPHSIERIEVVRGSGSTLYGSDAIGGVVNVLSRGPRFAGGQTDASARVLLRGMTDTMDRTVRAEGEVAGERWALSAGADVRPASPPSPCTRSTSGGWA